MADDSNPPGSDPPGSGPFDPFGGNNPFANLPMFGDIAKALSGQGPLNWDAAKQFAAMAATDGQPEPNVDPTVRIALDRLTPIIEMYVREITGFEATFPDIVPVTPGTWAQRTLDAYRPLFTEMATSLGRRSTTDGTAGTPGDDLDASDPMAAMTAMMANLSQLMAPSMMGMAVGSMVGRMATRTFGQYDLPIPRADHTMLLVPATIDRFAADWSLPFDEMRLWVLAQEMIGHVLFAIPALREQYTAIVRAYVAGFRADPAAVAQQLGGFDLGDSGDPMAALQRLLSDPAILLGAVQSPEQAAMAPQLDAAVAAVIGTVDYLVDAVAVRVIGGDALRIAEAVRRRRVETTPDDLFVERLLGLQINQAQVQRGKEFTAGVVDRVGESRLLELFASPTPIPTPAELAAPGLWIARLEL